MTQAQRRTRALYGALLERLGPQGWWPADSPEEVCVGAILTQAVAWTNAHRAVVALRTADLIEPRHLARADPQRVEACCRPAGYFRAKARKLQALARFVVEAGGLAALAARPTDAVRAALLAVHGVGPETADAILCYALGHPAMVADAYSRRVLGRVGLLAPDVPDRYAAAQAALAPCLPPGADAAWLGEWHALLVAVGKHWCRPRRPECLSCPAAAQCRHAWAHGPASVLGNLPPKGSGGGGSSERPRTASDGRG